MRQSQKINLATDTHRQLHLSPAALEYTGDTEIVPYVPAGFLRLLKSGGIACHTLKVVSPMYDNEGKSFLCELCGLEGAHATGREENILSLAECTEIAEENHE